MSGAPRGKLDAKKRAKAKDASTRFMRVDQLGSAPTVAMPAAQLLARAAASSHEQAGESTNADFDDAPTRAMPLAVAATLPAATVALASLASLAERRQGSASKERASAGRRSPSKTASRWRWTRSRIRALVAASIVVAVAASALAWARHAGGRSGVSPDRLGRPTPAAPRVPSTQPVEPSRHAPALAPAPAPDGAASPPAAGTSTVLPATAADQLAAGDYAAALTSYQALARARPEEPAFALVVTVLDRKRRARCPSDDAHAEAWCAP